MSDYFGQIMEVIQQAEHLGTKTLANGVRLIGHVPHVGPEGYLHELFPALDEQQIESVELAAGRRLPEELRAFYRRTNGMHLFSGALSVYGLRKSYVRTGIESWQPFGIHEANVLERPADADPNLVFFAFYDSDGSELGMFPGQREVYRFKRWTAQRVGRWPSFEEALISEVNRLAALFDEIGRKRDPEAPTAPQ